MNPDTPMQSGLVLRTTLSFLVLLVTSESRDNLGRKKKPLLPCVVHEKKAKENENE